MTRWIFYLRKINYSKSCQDTERSGGSKRCTRRNVDLNIRHPLHFIQPTNMTSGLQSMIQGSFYKYGELIIARRTDVHPGAIEFFGELNYQLKAWSIRPTRRTS
jgi:hypothetical protein